MARALKLTLYATLLLTLFSWPAFAQDKNTAPHQAPESVDSDADKDAGKSIYAPPGAVKSVEIGNFYLRRRQYYGALSRFKEAVEENSTYAPAYLGLGKVYEHLGLKQKALDAYQQYLDALPSEKDALEAKNVQRSVARLQHELKLHGRPQDSSASKPEAAPPAAH